MMGYAISAKLARQGKLCAALLFIPLLTGCMLTQWEYDHGITRYEGFKEPTRVLVSRSDGTVAIEVESFMYSPAEADRFFDRNDRRPFWERIPARSMHRRYLVASAQKIEELIDYNSRSSSHDREPPNALDLSIYLLPRQTKNERRLLYPHWNVIPLDFDASSAMVSDLPKTFAAGYDVYPWQRAEQLTFPSVASKFYWGWKDPVLWRARNGKEWRLSFSLMDYPDAARHERPINVLDPFRPVFWAADIATGPIQFFAVPIIFALNAGPAH